MANYHIAGGPEGSADVIEAVFGEALEAPKHYLIARNRKSHTEYFESLSTTWSKTKWTRFRECATGFATEGEAREFQQSFRLRGYVAENKAR
jgi:hypothetical protein